MNKNNNNVIIILLTTIIIILIVLIILLLTGTINITTNNISKENEQAIENKIDNTDNNNEENLLINNQNIYSDIINEYQKAIIDNSTTEWYDTNYKYINENAMRHYHDQLGTEYEFNFKYSFYDINNDGNYEMLINNGIIDIFSYDGNKIIRLFKDEAICLAESKCEITLYDNGNIYFRSSNGAYASTNTFYSINSNTSSLNTINSYYLKYTENGNLNIYDEKTYDYTNDTGTKLNYSSLDELISENLKNASAIDLDNLNWIDVK